MRQWTRIGVVSGLVLVTLLGGCAIGLDAINPDVLSTIGLDPTFLTGQPGKIIAPFDNRTSPPADFFIYTPVNSKDTPPGVNNSATLVDPGTSRNQVFDCPLGRVSPGNALNGMISTLAAAVYGAQQTT